MNDHPYDRPPADPVHAKASACRTAKTCANPGISSALASLSSARRADGADDTSSFAHDRVAGALHAEYGRLRSLARRWFPHADDGEDALQDLCVKALLRARSLRDPDKAYPWLRSILFNVIVDRHRRQEARKRAEQIFVEELIAVDATGPDRFATCGCLEAAMPKLRPCYARLLQRVDLAREPRPEVAASLGITLNNLRVQVLRARRALKQHMAVACVDCPAYDGRQCTCDHGTERQKSSRGVAAEV